ncbi:hypothetical protein [Haloferula sargassicola]
MKRVLLFLTLLLAACATGPALHRPDLALPDLARAHRQRTDVFSHYQTRGIARWNQDWPWQLDLTGIAWSDHRTATAVTPRHVVMADHFRLPPGKAIVFHDRHGRAHVRKVIRVLRLREIGTPCDVAVGLLDIPLPASIRTYPLPRVAADSIDRLVGATAVITGHLRNVDFRRIGRIQFEGKMLAFQYLAGQAGVRSHQVIVGDSGNPSFVLSHGELVLIETHTGGGAGVGPFYGSPEIIAGIERAIATTDPSQHLRFVAPDARTLAEAAEGRAQGDVPRLAP